MSRQASFLVCALGASFLDLDVFNIDGDGNLSKTEHGATIVWVKQ